jgi:epoxyqueuosine reductase
MSEDAITIALTKRIKQAAIEVGFDLVGVAAAQPFPHAEARLNAAVARGLLDGLDWFTAARAQTAADPRNLMPEAQSVISVGLCYLTDEAPLPSAAGAPRGRVAKYATSRDYHDVFKQKMAALLERVRGEIVAYTGSEAARLLVDTARIADRAAAEQAGLGWYGKNTNILTRRYGSWVLLGEILLPIALIYDQPIDRDCGACDLCLHACPTAALDPNDPYALITKRCISYLTIEERGPIPRELRPQMGDNIFGCDICQDVCPHNVRVSTHLPEQGRGHAEFRDGIGPSPELIPLLALDEESFRARFKGTPLRRAKRDGFLRNVAIALGNIGDPAALPALITALDDASPLVREHVAWAIGRIGGETAHEVLQMRLAVEEDARVREEIALSGAELASMHHS